VGQQYFAARPEARSGPGTVRVRLPDLDLELATDRGVFAGHRLDPGTETLLRRGEQTVPDGEVLDLGCGYGPIAVVLARRNPETAVWAVDVNERARDLADRNARAAGATNVRVAAPDDVPAGVRFAAIWSNPPIRIGKAALHDLLLRWLARPAPGGIAHLVVHKHLGSDSLHRWLADQGFTVVRRASHQGYRLLDVHPPARP
jgi:16S rRNA (guanine1207-N2)-methyltransferase